MLERMISVQEYLSTAFHPDVDYVDGHIEERNVGEKEHSKLQGRVYAMLLQLRVLVPFVEARLQVSATSYRVPDICAYEAEPDEEVFTQAPVLCVEILSPEDRMSRITSVTLDYLAMGVPNVWVLDPSKKKAYAASHAVPFHEVTDRISTVDGRVAFALADLFSGRIF
jgi:Uma2 family endonuclease